MDHVETAAVGASLAHLLDRVARGERIAITDQGRPVALLVPPGVAIPADPAAVGRDMLAYRDQVRRHLGDTPRDLAHDEHRY